MDNYRRAIGKIAKLEIHYPLSTIHYPLSTIPRFPLSPSLGAAGALGGCERRVAAGTADARFVMGLGDVCW
jgi:hypothetical protein